MALGVLLVNPNRLRPAVAPLALDYLGDVLRARGFATHLLDLCFESRPEEAVARALGEREFGLIAVTVRNTDDCYLASGEDFLPGFAGIVAALRRHSGAPIAIGGSGYSVSPRAILEALGGDYGVAGDGEAPLAMLAEALAGTGDRSSVPGLVWREGNEIRLNPPWVGRLDLLPRRERGLLDNRRYLAEGGQAGI